VLAASGTQKDDFDVSFMSGEGSKPVEWHASAGTSPFLSERRIVIVRHLLQGDPEEAKGVDFKNLPESALLIVVADDENASTEDKLRGFAAKRTKWEKIFAAADGHVETFKINPKEVKEAVKRDAVRLGKKLSDKAADTLVEMTGGSLSRALDELEKLAIFTGDQDQIRESEVRDVVVPSREWNVFRMIDSIVSGAVPEALRQMRILVGSQVKAEEAGIARVLPMMSRQLRFLWQARLCIEARCSPADPTPEVIAMLPAKPNIAAEQPYRQSALVAAARKTSLPNLRRAMQVVADTDARLKGSLPSFSGMETLERMVLDLAKALNPK
jgi:DNA polymerase III subunit delta